MATYGSMLGMVPWTVPEQRPGWCRVEKDGGRGVAAKVGDDAVALPLQPLRARTSR